MAIFWVNQGDNFAIEQEECRLNYDPIGKQQGAPQTWLQEHLKRPLRRLHPS